MNSKTKRIVIWSVALAVIAAIVIAFIVLLHSVTHPDITKNQWADMLQEHFGYVCDDIAGNGDEEANGRYIAITSMRVLGEERLQHMSPGGTDEDALVDLAVKKKLISKGKLKSGMSEKEAERLIGKLMDFYCSDKYYPQYLNAVYAENVLDATGWTMDSHSDDYGTIIINSPEPIEPGDILLVKNEWGIAFARKVYTSDDRGNQKYVVTTGAVSDAKEVVQEASFSGVGDFSYLLAQTGGKKKSQTNLPVGSSLVSAKQPTAMLCADYPALLTAGNQVINTTASSPSIDLEIEFEIGIDNEGEVSYSITPRINGDFFNPQIPFLGVSSDSALDDFIDLLDSDVDLSGGSKYGFGAEASVNGTLSFQDLTITASGYVDTVNPLNPQNYVDTNVSADIEISAGVSGEMEGTMRVFTMPVPVATNGIFFTQFSVYLVVGADGEVTATYGLEGAHMGMSLSAVRGLQTRHEHDDDDFDITANAGFHVGARCELKVSLLMILPICDPCVDVMAGGSAEVLETRSGYEQYPPCVDLKLFAPTIELKGHNEEDSLAYLLIDFLGIEDTIVIIDDDYAYKRLWGKQVHIEKNLDGTTTSIKGDVRQCTRISKEDLEEVIQEKLNEALAEKAEQAAQKVEEKKEQIVQEAEEKFMNWLQKKLEEWLQKNCGGC